MQLSSTLMISSIGISAHNQFDFPVEVLWFSKTSFGFAIILALSIPVDFVSVFPDKHSAHLVRYTTGR